jgi:hypothetical protein
MAMRRVGLPAAAVAVAVAGCGGGGGAPAASPPAPPGAVLSSAAPVSASPTPSVVDQVLTQYTAFWAMITPASQAPVAQRRAVLAPYAMDPELSRLLRGLVAAEAVGEGQYGAEVPRARVASVRGAVADVVDCQDASNAGKISLKTGKKLTRGVVRNPVTATLRRASDGRWRVATVEFGGGGC